MTVIGMVIDVVMIVVVMIVSMVIIGIMMVMVVIGFMVASKTYFRSVSWWSLG
jgi:hypothetical protein